MSRGGAGSGVTFARRGQNFITAPRSKKLGL